MSSRKSTPALCCFTPCFLFVLLTCLTTTSRLVDAEFYSSIDSLKQLGGIESTLLQSFRSYSDSVREEIDVLRGFVERIKHQHEMANKDVEDYLGNPINAFTLIKRVVIDWQGVTGLLRFDAARDELLNTLTQLKNNSKLPDERELKGAIMGLARLQDIYDLKPEVMANGKGYGDPLTWRECFEIATTYSEEKMGDLALSWFQIAYNKLQMSQESAELKKYFSIQIKEHTAFIYEFTGRQQLALQNLDEILKDAPQHHIKLTKKIFSKARQQAVIPGPPKERDYAPNYAQLCQGLRPRNRRPLNLKCRLDSSTHPFFIINPLQIEPVLEDPPIMLYHHLLTDRQIFGLINQTESHLYRSQVVKGPNESQTTEIRVSQQVWVKREEHPTAAWMYRLVHHISGMNTTNSEQIQVANYGIGGQYAPHYDYLEGNHHLSGLLGDRVATSMFYLSNVIEGGYTIFPRLNAFVRPVKGAMVMWYNLHKSLETDERTLHGGCPVLKGSKRIGNVWTRSGYQDIVRPCELYDDKALMWDAY